jgi:3-hydroxyacyl-CoA dehydrogenase
MADVKRAAVVGTGTMGPGMGAVLARAGIEVALYDVSAEALERAEAGFALADGVLDRLETPRVEGGGIRYESDLTAALAGAEFVAEAIPERLELKQELFPQLEKLAAPGAILSSNTSGIPITRIAELCADPSRVVGLHWSNPPHLIPMIEVIPGEQTSQETVEASVALVERLGYEAVIEREVPGFVENRILYAIMREAVDLVDRGIIDADGMDRCVRWGIGYKLAVIGPMELLDMAGLDIYTSVASFLNADLSNESGISSTATDLRDQGRLGIKSGGGFFDYTPERVQELQQQRGAALVAVRKALS